MSRRGQVEWVGVGLVVGLSSAAMGQEATPGDLATPGMPGASSASGTAAQGVPGGPPAGQPSGPAGFGMFLPLMIALFGFMIISSMMGQRKEKKKQRDMLGNLQKHDKVQTVGGLIGTIVEVKDREVVLKVDEQAGTKIRFSRSSVQQVLSSRGDSSGDGGGDGGVESAVGSEIVEVDAKTGAMVS